MYPKFNALKAQMILILKQMKSKFALTCQFLTLRNLMVQRTIKVADGTVLVAKTSQEWKFGSSQKQGFRNQTGY
uniref:Uncharacterized protein n=1 Tax=Rhizophora mucronata TaxID=61149 RepID=A0A2P2Q6H9_RHIMU